MASTGDTWRLGRRPALDGLRGVAVLLVVAGHTHVTDWIGAVGPIGVTIFFTLSGFLITSLLLEERERTGQVNLLAFYGRRARRLLPALGVFLGVTAVAAASIAPWLIPSGRDVIAAVLYIGNWLPANGIRMGAIEQTWSLAVEEQFYLVWPPVLALVAAFVPARRAVLTLAGLGVVYAVTARALMFHGGAGELRIYYGSDTRADGLLIGCALAALLHARRERPLPPWCALVGVAGVLPLLALSGHAQLLTVPIVVPLLTVLVIWTAVVGRYSGWLTLRPLVVVGQRSYGLYLWHFPLLGFLMPRTGLPVFIAVPLFVGLAWGATAISWRYVEQPFMRRRTPDRDGASPLLQGRTEVLELEPSLRPSSAQLGRPGSLLKLELEVVTDRHRDLGCDEHGRPVSA